MDVQTAEIMWRRDELKPIPDSMSQFTDYETLFSKEALHCGLVSRQSHRHWVHVVGTEYDMMEWDEYDPQDQGVGAPKIFVPPKPNEPIPQHRRDMALVLTALGFDMDTSVRALKACNDNADVAAQRLMTGETFPEAAEPQGQDASDDEEEGRGPQSIFQMIGHRMPAYANRHQQPGQPPKPKAPKVVEHATFTDVVYDRPFDPYSEAPNYGMEHESEFWIGDILGPILLSIYPEEPPERKMNYKLLLPSEPMAAMKNGQPQLGFGRLIGMVDPTKDHATWKEVIVCRERSVVHVYNLVSHGRKIFRSLVYTNDSRFCLHSLPPNVQDRSSISACVVHEAGDFKRKVVNEPSLVISRRNASIQGHEVFIPSRLLQGLVPSSILEAFR